MDHRAELVRTIEEAEVETGRAAQKFLPEFKRRMDHFAARYARATNPFSRRYYRMRLKAYTRRVEEARAHIEKAAFIKASRGLAPRR